MRKMMLLIVYMLLTLGFTACGGDNTIRYAVIVDTDSALQATQGQYNSVKAMLVQPGDTVQILMYFKDYSKVGLGLDEGYVPTKNLEIMTDAEAVEKIHKEREAIAVPFSLWVKRHVFIILLCLALLVIATIIIRIGNPSFKTMMYQLMAYVLMIGIGIFLMNSNYEAYSDQMDISFGNPKFWDHFWNVLMITVYFFTIIGGYLNTGNSLLLMGGTRDLGKRKKGVGLYLWMVVLVLIASSLAKKYDSNIPYYILLALFAWVMFNHCRQVWPKVHYPIIVALLGLFAGVAMMFTIVHIMRSFLLLLLYGGGLFALLRNPSVLFSESESSVPVSNTPVQDPYDKVIKGAGMFGGDLKARENFDGSLTDEGGGHWVETEDGQYRKG